MRKILIIKLGALGDVMRTTPILRRLSGSVTWITSRRALPLLAGNPRIARLITPGDFPGIRGEDFDWVINFDEDARACALAAEAKAPKKTGALLNAGRPDYCESSAPWFDMSLISRLGIKEADRLKYRARKSYQHYLFQACGFEFGGEEYILPPLPAAAARPLVGIEERTGHRWPLKRWPGCGGLTRLLKGAGIDFIILRQRRKLLDYISDIGSCAVLVSGDTLAMHAALALGRRAVTVFNCTSPGEIYGYGRLSKLLHPRLRDLFYSTGDFDESLGSVKEKAVFDAVIRALRTDRPPKIYPANVL